MTVRAIPERIGPYLIIRLPDTISAALPSRGLVMAEGELNGTPYKAPLEPDGAKGHWLEISAALAEQAGAAEGREVLITIEPAADWPEPEMPEDIMSMIREADLMETWDSLTVKARWEWLRWIRSPASEQTRSKRIGTARSKLSAGDRRPCCFNSASCTVPGLAKSGVLLNTQSLPKK